MRRFIFLGIFLSLKFSMKQTEVQRSMGEGDILEERRSLAAPLIFLIVIVFQFATKRFPDLKKAASKTDKEIQLRGEIKQLLKEAASFSQPSTFAQAAKRLGGWLLPRRKNLRIVLTNVVLVFWFWRSPVASVFQQLVQPFGKMLSWKTGGSLNNNVVVKNLGIFSLLAPLIIIITFSFFD
ncbi:hypothetical protein REPUB_Repub13aG0040300 [Reevesia pubescens]